MNVFDLMKGLRLEILKVEDVTVRILISRVHIWVLAQEIIHG